MSLALAQRLKALGVKQESICTWSRETPSRPYRLVYGIAQPWLSTDTEHSLAAFTVAELGELLPVGCGSTVTLWEDGLRSYSATHRFNETDDEVFISQVSEAEARGLLLAALLERGAVRT